MHANEVGMRYLSHYNRETGLGRHPAGNICQEITHDREVQKLIGEIGTHELSQIATDETFTA